MKTLLTPTEAAAALRVSRTTVFALLRDGRIASIQIGRLRRIPTEAIEGFVAELRRETCDHTWPGNLSADAACDQCGLAYSEYAA